MKGVKWKYFKLQRLIPPNDNIVSWHYDLQARIIFSKDFFHGNDNMVSIAYKRPTDEVSRTK